MSIPECSICNEEYDDEVHRPRALPCGHGFCTKCMDANIATGSTLCPICRTNHRAKSAKNLPVNFPLEELLHHEASTSGSQTHEASTLGSQTHGSETEQKYDSISFCPKHKGVPFFYQCTSHKVKVCQSCAVIDHHTSSCTLIELVDQLEDMKQVEIVAVQKRKQGIMIIQEDLNKMKKRANDDKTEQKSKKQHLEQEIRLLVTKIDKVDQEIVKKQTLEGSITSAMQSCQKNQKEFEVLENKLRTAMSSKKITEECQAAANKIIKNEEWEEKLRSDLIVKTVKYAQVERNGILRSSKVIFKGSRTIVPCLSKDILPSTSADLMQEAELCLTLSTMTVFLDISVSGGLSLGRIQIRVLSNRPAGKQFVMLALGTDGNSYKAATFGYKTNGCIGLEKYLTEGHRKAECALVSMRKENDALAARGRLFTRSIYKAGFIIITKDWEASWHGYIGDVLTGLEVVDRAASDEFANTNIIISNCGIVIEPTILNTGAPRI